MPLLLPRLLFFLCCLPITIFISQVSAANNEQKFHFFCDDTNYQGTYTTDSTYHTNLNTLLSTLISNTEIHYGFYNFTNGESTDKVYAIGLCRGDIKADECRRCLNDSRANLTKLCPNQKEVIGWYEDEKCMLRYSPRSIFGVMEDGKPTYYADSRKNATDLDEFNKDVNELLLDLRRRAASGDSRVKYAANSTLGHKVDIYGLVQCTPDLDESECLDCLNRSITRIPIDCCTNKTGGRVVRPSCNMRFETSKFYGDPAFVPPGPPPPPPPEKWKKIIIAIATAVAVVSVVVIFIYIGVKASKSWTKFESKY